MTIRRRKKIKMMIPLASMGDIAFLLIIFFMLVSSFMKNTMEFDPATSDDVRDLPPAELSVVLDKFNRLWLQGIEITPNELAPAVEVLVGDRRADSRVHLSIHKELKRKDYMPVIEALSETGVPVNHTGKPSES
jgi:biopolymer transport protein ExbD